jgi:hypothetical protein
VFDYSLDLRWCLSGDEDCSVPASPVQVLGRPSVHALFRRTSGGAASSGLDRPPSPQSPIVGAPHTTIPVADPNDGWTAGTSRFGLHVATGGAAMFDQASSDDDSDGDGHGLVFDDDALLDDDDEGSEFRGSGRYSFSPVMLRDLGLFC